jgi:predicted Zn finger-like uncharacterized protein
MSFVTRCTSCGTLFKVVADQLKISDGWVRCGQCATVFDAQSNLVKAQNVSQPVPAPPVVASPPVPMAASESSEPAETPALEANPAGSASLTSNSMRDSAFNKRDREALLAAFEPYRTSSSSPSTFSGLTGKPISSSPSAIPSESSASSLSKADSALEAAGLDSASFRPGQMRGSDDLDNEAGPPTSTWASSEYDRAVDIARSAEAAVSFSAEPTTVYPPSSVNAGLPETDLSAPSTAPQMPTPGFVKQAQRVRRWRSPWVRFGLCMLSLVLLAALALQIALHEKDRIAAQWPQSKIWLQQLCMRAGCQVQDLRRIESIAVDASSFNRINKNNAQLEAITQSYRLAVTLKNTGSLPVALAYIELSLQDQQDQTVLRRVLSPADLGMSLTALAPSQISAGSLTLQVDTAQLAGSKVQGYRVLAFYP